MLHKTIFGLGYDAMEECLLGSQGRLLLIFDRKLLKSLGRDGSLLSKQSTNDLDALLYLLYVWREVKPTQKSRSRGGP